MQIVHAHTLRSCTFRLAVTELFSSMGVKSVPCTRGKGVARVVCVCVCVHVCVSVCVRARVYAKYKCVRMHTVTHGSGWTMGLLDILAAG